MGERRELPYRRQCHTFEVEWQGNIVIVTLGNYDDGEPAEVFLNIRTKVGTGIDALLRDVGVCISFMMQHGVSLAPVLTALTLDQDNQVESLIGVILEHVLAEAPRLKAEAHPQLMLVPPPEQPGGAA